MNTRILLCLAALLVSTEARATTVNGTVTGSIGGSGSINTIDTYGLFSSPETDLSGRSFVLSYSYNTSDFANSPRTCGTNCTDYNETTLSTAESLSFTVNGITQQYEPAVGTYVEFQNAFTTYPTNFFDESIDSALNGYRGASAAIFSAAPVAFGQPIMPGGSGQSDITFYTSTGGYESFNIVPGAAAVTPEPATVSLVATGLLLSYSSLKRRFA